MKKKLLWVMTAILTISGTTTALISCAGNDDNAVVTPSAPGPLAEKIEGLWWADRNVKEPTKEFADHLSTCALWMLSVTFGMW